MNRYRYVLTRDVGEGSGQICWVMLNPSTADDIEDDPTIRKCMGFARRWGYRKIIVTNLFALRATDPAILHCTIKVNGQYEAIGVQNNIEIGNAAKNSDICVVAWGINGARYKQRIEEVLSKLHSIHCIGLTKAGYPYHPVMAGYTTTPIPYPGERYAS